MELERLLKGSDILLHVSDCEIINKNNQEFKKRMLLVQRNDEKAIFIEDELRIETSFEKVKGNFSNGILNLKTENVMYLFKMRSSDAQYFIGDFIASEWIYEYGGEPFKETPKIVKEINLLKIFNKLEKNYLNLELENRRKEFTTTSIINILCFTFNTAGLLPSNIILNFVETSNIDIIVISLQETDKEKNAVLTPSKRIGEKWIKNFQIPLKLKSFTEQSGVFLAIFSNLEDMDEIEKINIPLGTLGMYGGKGACCIKFKVYESTIMFIGCHLAHSLNAVPKRNLDIKRIKRKIPESDICIWLGDFNYKIDLDDLEIRELVNLRDFTKLFQFDQLNNQDFTTLFEEEGYLEGEITFKPTYKYESLDTYTKSRPPAWCDRIIYKGNLEIEKYDSYIPIFSDHTAVYANFKCNIKIFDEKKALEFKENFLIENITSIPEAKLSQNILRYEIRFGVPQLKWIKLTNTGRIWSAFKFSRLPNWITVQPNFGVVLPGRSIDISLTIEAYSKISKEEILQIFLENDSVLYIKIICTVLPSCFGMSLDELTKYNGPVRTDIKGDFLNSIPKELWRMVDFIYSKKQTPELFFELGSPEESALVREALDTCSEFPNVSVHSVTNTILIFFDALPVPLIPYSMYHSSILHSENPLDCKKIIDQLPDVHYNVFVYMISFLKELLQYGNAELMIKKFSEEFGKRWIRPFRRRRIDKDLPKKMKFVGNFFI